MRAERASRDNVKTAEGRTTFTRERGGNFNFIGIGWRERLEPLDFSLDMTGERNECWWSLKGPVFPSRNLFTLYTCYYLMQPAM
eukprot:scaffold13057_cov75-Skeletonema_dohrnii-CCMP3373.AAC.3